MSALYLGEMEQATNEVQPVGRWGYHFTKEDEEWFWGKVDRTTTPYGCWLWLDCVDRDGYGQVGVNGRQRKAHHIALELAGFIIPVEFLQVLHLCDNRSCCRPSHLRIGTPKDNTDDRDTKERQARGERQGLVC